MSGIGNERNLQVYSMLVKIEQIIDSMKRVLEEPRETEAQGGSDNSKSHVQMIKMLTSDLNKICKLINTKLRENPPPNSSFNLEDESRPYISFFHSLIPDYQEQHEINYNLQYISEFLRGHIDGCTEIISKENEKGCFDIVLRREGLSNIRIYTSIEGDIQDPYICTHITLI